jgi:hypothetical protein
MALNPDLVSDPKDLNFFLVYKPKFLFFYPRLVNVLACIVRRHKSFSRVVLLKKEFILLKLSILLRNCQILSVSLSSYFNYFGPGAARGRPDLDPG